MRLKFFHEIISNSIDFFDYSPPGRSLKVFNSDVFIVSYPKSGNTWLRFLVGNLINKKNPITFANIEDNIPDIYQNSKNVLKALPNPRFLKSHEYFDPRYPKVIYIIRDPRDVAVSYYYYLIKMKIISENYPLRKYINRFINGELDRFGSWKVHAGSWIGAMEDDKNFLLIKYENVLKDTKAQLKSIANFLNIETTEELIDEAVSLSSFKNMQALEKKAPSEWKAIKSGLKDKPFMRSGKSGQWQSELPIELVAQIEQKWNLLMKNMGYL